MSDNLPSDRVIASAVKFLIEGGDHEAATMLLDCECEVSVWEAEYEQGPDEVYVRLVGPRGAYEHLSDSRDPIYEQVWTAINAVLPVGYRFSSIDIRANLLTDVGPDWRSESLELARGKSVNNQAVNVDSKHTWSGFRFRSVTESIIAQALDRAGVLFLPLPKARLNGPRGRANLEPDFLVCHGGRWGMLEVDGERYHPPTRTVQDHERDRLFQQHGIRVVSHFDATDCFATPDKVVSDFLRLIEKAY